MAIISVSLSADEKQIASYIILDIKSSFHWKIIVMRSSSMLSVTTSILMLMLQSVPVVRLECINGALLRAQCSSVSKVRCEYMASA